MDTCWSPPLYQDRQEHFWLLIRHNSNTPPMHFWKLCQLDVLLTLGRELV